MFSPRITVMALLVAVVLLVSGTEMLNADTAKLSEQLQARLAVVDEVETIKVVAFMSYHDASTSKRLAVQPRAIRSREGHQAAISSFKSTSPAEASFHSLLDGMVITGEITNLRKFWIADVVAFSASAKVIEQLASHSDVYLIAEDYQLELIEPVSIAAAATQETGSSYSIDVAAVRTLWQMGYTGRGRLVASLDTGVEGIHPALSASWLGNNGGTVNQSWFDPYGSASPVDNNGHGTHTMGIMAGRAGSDTIGVAFNANWIAAAVIDRGQTLNKTISDILAAYEWCADPDGDPSTVDDVPDVVCNSWGIPASLMEPCDETFWQAIDNLEALGVVVVFACGNEGPDPSTIRNPADRASSPVSSFSIGAVDQNNPGLPIAHFSSRGPSGCDSTSTKPELVAPGVAIRSCYNDGGYRSISGTSMAAPFVAGVVALLREYNPDATVEEIKNALIQSTTDLGTVGKDNDYGAGFINAAAALAYLPAPTKPQLEVTSLYIGQSPDGRMMPGSTTELELTLTSRITDAVDIYGELTCSDPHATVFVDSSFFGTILRNEEGSNVGAPFLVKLDFMAEHGSVLELEIDFYSSELGYINSDWFELIIAEPTVAQYASLQNQLFDCEVSNFSVSRRIFNLSEGIDLLSQMSLMITDGSGRVYDGVPGNLDFIALENVAVSHYTNNSEALSRYQTDDDLLNIEQRTTIYSEPGYQNLMILTYEILPLAPIPSLDYHAGLALDIDAAGGELILSENADFLFRNDIGNQYVGVRILTGAPSYAYAMAGDTYKSGGFTDSEKYQVVSEGVVDLSTAVADKALLVGNGPIQPVESESFLFAAVLAIGDSEAEILLALERGEARYNQVTDITEDNTVIPESFTLAQNFPNPFNNETLIKFSLPRVGDYKLEILNVLGQRVRVFSADATNSGYHTIAWDSTNGAGECVSSGIYFYKLSFGGNSQVRKMVLLK